LGGRSSEWRWYMTSSWVGYMGYTSNQLISGRHIPTSLHVHCTLYMHIYIYTSIEYTYMYTHLCVQWYTMNKHVCVCEFVCIHSHVCICGEVRILYVFDVYPFRASDQVFPPERMRKAMPAAAATGPDEQMRRLPKEPMWTIQWAVAYFEKKS